MVKGLKTVDWISGVAIAVAGSFIGVGVLFVGGSLQVAFWVTGIVWIASVSLLIMFLYRRLSDQITRVGKEIGNTYRQIEALMNLRAEIDAQKALPPMRGWAISPDFAALLVEKLTQKCPQNVLECGSGVSSLIAGYVLKGQNKGHLTSLEHDEDYVAVCRDRIRAHELSEYVTIVHAPLIKYEIDGEQWCWYDINSIEGKESFDFLIVDGPPDVDGEMLRYPTFAILKERIMKGAVLLLDDADRLGERKCLELWARSFPEMDYEIVSTEKGAAVIHT